MATLNPEKRQEIRRAGAERRNPVGMGVNLPDVELTTIEPPAQAFLIGFEFL